MAQRTEWDFTDATNVVPVIPNEIIEPDFDDADFELAAIAAYWCVHHNGSEAA